MDINIIMGLISNFALSNPKLAGFCTVAYAIGFMAKVIRESVEKFVKESPSLEDDKKLEEIEQKPFFKYSWMMLDLFFRMKKTENK